LVVTPFGWAQSSSTQDAAAIAQVNGKAISLAAFEQALQDQLRAGTPDSPALREAIRRDLVIQAVLAQEAEKARLDRTPELEQRLAAARSALLAQAWQQQWLNANPPTEAEVQAEYDQLKARTGNKEYQIRLFRDAMSGGHGHNFSNCVHCGKRNDVWIRIESPENADAMARRRS
jgi:peptidyl-prolyl cis-trans isomerase C